MIDIIRIREYGEGTYIVTYDLVSPCGCSRDRRSMSLRSEKEPTEEKIRVLIDAELKNK